MDDEVKAMSPHRRWAAFRHAVIGPLLASPPENGELADTIRGLAARAWVHPITGVSVEFRFSTIEGWFYQARRAVDPVEELRWKTRSDVGKPRALTAEMIAVLTEQYGERPYWSHRLHADNLEAALAKKSPAPTAPSYATVHRYMRANGLVRLPKPRDSARESTGTALAAGAQKEKRSYEKEHVGALLHADFHKTELRVLAADGAWHTPILVAFFDDHSRFCCHMQWYIEETAENLVHAASQAILKRGLAREIMTDNGCQMTSAEYRTGLSRLSCAPQYTGVKMPYQNGKCESKWIPVDGRLVAMVDGQKDLTLRRLNDLTQVWVEGEYNRTVNRETKARPIDRFAGGKNVMRASPPPEALRKAFRREVTRRQRKSDGTVSIDGTRFELPQRLRHVIDITIAYAKWDMSFVHVIDGRSGGELARIHPVDKIANASGRRRTIVDPVLVRPITETTRLPPLMQRLVDEAEQSGFKPAYIPKDDTQSKKGDNDDSE